MVDTELQVLKPEPGLALIRLEAEGRRNALTGDMARGLVSSLRTVAADPEVGALIISGGRRSFCAGADRSVLAGAAEGAEEAIRDLRSIYEVFEFLRGLELPTVAAVCGPAVGAGLNVALACDVRIIGSNAYLRSMFLANSIHPAGGHLKMLKELCSASMAIQLAVFDQPLDAASAVAAGLGLGPHDPDTIEEEAIAFSKLAAAQPRLSRTIKRSVGAVGGLGVESATEYEGEMQAASLQPRQASGR